jgi:diguanylate cyclase (GGDEF)-like protein
MRPLQGLLKRVFGEYDPITLNYIELSLYLPRLFVLRPSSGIGQEYLASLDRLSDEATHTPITSTEELRAKILAGATDFSAAQKAEFESLLEEISTNTHEFLTKLSFFVEVQSARLKEIEGVRKNLESAQAAPTLNEMREQLGIGMSSLQKMVEAELKRQSDLCTDRDAYATRLEDKLESVEKESRTDALTGVANRAGCIKKIEGVLDYVRTNTGVYSLAMLDLNRFKMINDTLGHAAGDAALIAFSNRLETAVGKGNFVGRLSGDEFIVLAKYSPASLSNLLDKLLEQFAARPATFKGLSLDISFSYGICQIEKGQNSSSVLEEADKMLYRHKNAYYEKRAA